MGEGAILIAFIVAQRLAELVLAQANTRRLTAAGGVEFGRSHYPWIVALHIAWLACLVVLGSDRAVDRWWLLAFLALQAARVWTIASLGRRWTTRIVVVPGEARVTRGPYRLLRHPNYCIVAAEIAVVPLALGLPWLAVIFFILNGVMLAVRIKAEEAALEWAAKPQEAVGAPGLESGQTLANGRPSL